jgi:hypothetical protein
MYNPQMRSSAKVSNLTNRQLKIAKPWKVEDMDGPWRGRSDRCLELSGMSRPRQVLINLM